MEKAESVTKISYRADIDGMRALAVMMVLVFHFELISLSEAGFIGVDVFFVISGFLITSILKRQFDVGKFGIVPFYTARIRRLAPALLSVLMFVMMAGAVLLFADDFMELSRQVLASQFYVANIYFWKNVNYFGLGKDDVFLLHMWSLGVEEQFYLLYPTVLLVIYKYQKRWFWPAIAIGLFASFALNVMLVARKPEAAFYLLPTRGWELFAGALVYYGSTRWTRPRALDELLGVLGLGFIFVAIMAFRRDFHFPGYFALLPVVGAGSLLISGGGAGTVVSRLLSLRPITYIGKISYPLYLVHWPIKVFVTRFSDQGGPAWRWTMLATSILLAAAVYHLVENPIRRRYWLSSNHLLLRGYAVGLALTLTIGFFIGRGDGLPQRFPADVSRLASFVNDRSPPLSECLFGRKRPLSEHDFCRIGKIADKPKWLIFGDSHAWAGHAVFDRWLQSKGDEGLFMFLNSCPPVVDVHLFGDHEEECFSFNRAVVDFVDKDQDLDNVVLVSAWAEALEGRLSTSEDIMLSKEASVGLFNTSFSKTLSYLHSIGKRIYVWEPVPGATQSVPQSLAWAALQNRPASIEFTSEEYRANNEFFFSALAKNRHSIAVSFSPSEALCSTGHCAVTINGDPAYFDSSHITRSPWKFWVRMMQQAEDRSSIGIIRK